MNRVSRKTPFYFLTSIAKDRLPIFRTQAMGTICAAAFDEARRSAGFRIFAYVIMLDHVHLITNSAITSSEVLRYLNGIAAKRIIDNLKENGHQASLLKLREETKKRNYKHSVWEHHPNVFEVYGEDTLMQKVNYIHQNPVRAGLAEKPEDHLFSSARIWNGKAIENEPLVIDKIDWR
jgi:REP element-mobilizing transposase RayT